jgi:ubiquinone/menaquinone biosynthesis C-methylase UbiE
MAQFITDHIATLSVTAKKHYNSMKRQGHDVLRPQRNTPQEKAATLHHSIQYLQRNAEDTQLPNKSYDLVTVMYAFHEAPHQGRERILKEARRLLSPGGVLAVVDISTAYTPSPNMLRGEPYVQEYQRNIHRQLANFAGFERPKYQDVVPHHLGMWTLKRSASRAYLHRPSKHAFITP